MRATGIRSRGTPARHGWTSPGRLPARARSAPPPCLSPTATLAGPPGFPWGRTSPGLRPGGRIPGRTAASRSPGQALAFPVSGTWSAGPGHRRPGICQVWARRASLHRPHRSRRPRRSRRRAGNISDSADRRGGALPDRAALWTTGGRRPRRRPRPRPPSVGPRWCRRRVVRRGSVALMRQPVRTSRGARPLGTATARRAAPAPSMVVTGRPAQVVLTVPGRRTSSPVPSTPADSREWLAGTGMGRGGQPPCPRRCPRSATPSGAPTPGHLPRTFRATSPARPCPVTGRMAARWPAARPAAREGRAPIRSVASASTRRLRVARRRGRCPTAGRSALPIIPPPAASHRLGRLPHRRPRQWHPGRPGTPRARLFRPQAVRSARTDASTHGRPVTLLAIFLVRLRTAASPPGPRTRRAASPGGTRCPIPGSRRPSRRPTRSASSPAASSSVTRSSSASRVLPAIPRRARTWLGGCRRPMRRPQAAVSRRRCPSRRERWSPAVAFPTRRGTRPGRRASRWKTPTLPSARPPTSLGCRSGPR